ncbi:MAG: hypothetical protein RR524_00335 [Erysipelotrichaceae bacterium]
MSNQEQEALFRAYILAWLDNNITIIYEIFDLHASITQSNGAAYEDLNQIIDWFKDSQNNGSIETWQILSFQSIQDLTIVKWNIDYSYQKQRSTFQGVSYVSFKNERINSMEEYGRYPHLVYPYR